jgi:hypothetical protein
MRDHNSLVRSNKPTIVRVCPVNQPGYIDPERVGPPAEVSCQAARTDGSLRWR